MTPQPSPLTEQIADEAPPQSKRECPDCHRLITFRIEGDQIVLDWHRAKDDDGNWQECRPKRKQAKR